jgi:uncharacterized protein (DUF58 family)
MDTHELLKRISALPIIADNLSEDILAGNFRSIFKGQGIEFDEVRHYQLGDDIRSIDWNASARFGYPFVKMYREERDLAILLLLDTSASMRRAGSMPGSEQSAGNHLSPYEQGLLAAALIAFSAEHTGQRVGAFLFDREIDKVFPPRKGRRHIMSLIGGALQYQYMDSRKKTAGSNLAAAMSGAGGFLGRRSLVVIISDFYSADWEDEIKNLCHKHDVFALRISTPLDLNLPEWGLTEMEDPETGLKISSPLGFSSFRDAWSRWHEERAEIWAGLCRRCGAAQLELSTGADAAAALFRFFSSGPWKSPHRNAQGRGRRIFQPGDF